ncbi:hypothetical protein GCM10009733_021180 [Nonomuraea maheshkhaliensis]|uniref:Uncharacterized protein n=1 Tax=Nonomuraea maheshkhaliensis TaxID=419590 RepID=A0ABP4QVT8_9ACTN
MTPAEDRKYGTPYAETEILVALAAQDIHHGRALLADMMPGERRALEHHCEEVINLIQLLREDEM